MKTGTYWLALFLTASVTFGLGIAFGVRTDTQAASIAEFFNKWQSLIAAFVAIVAMAATLQAGWWALSGPREQIQAMEKQKVTDRENRYRAVRANVLIDLNSIIDFSKNCMYYISNGNELTARPALSDRVIDNLTELIELNKAEINQQAISMVEEIQLVTSWVSDIHSEKSYISNARSISMLQCLLLYARSMKWFAFARSEATEIDNSVDFGDIESSIHILKAPENSPFRDIDFDFDGLNREIHLHFGLPDPEI